MSFETQRSAEIERGGDVIERRELDDGVAEHWRLDDGSHLVRFMPSGGGVPTEHRVPGDKEDDPIGWWQRTQR